MPENELVDLKGVELYCILCRIQAVFLFLERPRRNTQRLCRKLSERAAVALAFAQFSALTSSPTKGRLVAVYICVQCDNRQILEQHLMNDSLYHRRPPKRGKKKSGQEDQTRLDESA